MYECAVTFMYLHTTLQLSRTPSKRRRYQIMAIDILEATCLVRAQHREQVFVQ